MKKNVFEVVGKSDIIREDASKSFSVLHCVGDPFYGNLEGFEVCTCFVGLNEYCVGDKLDVIKVKNDYIVLNKHV